MPDRQSGGTSEVHLDLRGVRCPLNWAKARVQLEQMQPGAQLVLLLDDPRAVRDLPRAAEACGYVLAGMQEVAAGLWRVEILR